MSVCVSMVVLRGRRARRTSSTWRTTWVFSTDMSVWQATSPRSAHKSYATKSSAMWHPIVVVALSAEGAGSLQHDEPEEVDDDELREDRDAPGEAKNPASAKGVEGGG